MSKPSIHHLALTSSALERAREFYGELLGLLGYHLHIDDPEILAWSGPDPEILIYPAREDQKGRDHRLYDPGIHHIAFRVDSRAAVDSAFEIATRLRVLVLESPKTFSQYHPDYYATFFHDPDGIKLEVMHIGG